MTYDVIIAGAGLSGLAAAEVLSAKQKKVLLLEARNQIGGRVARQQVDGGVWIDRGAQWAEGQNIMKYVNKFEITTFEPYAGKGLWAISYGEGPSKIVADPPAPDTESREAAEKLDNQLRFTARVQNVTADPWRAEDASVLDGMTLGQWIAEEGQGERPADEFARYYVDWNSRFQQSGGSSWEVSLLHALFEIVNQDDAQAYLLVGGAGQLPYMMLTDAEKLGAELIRGSQVVAITQDLAGVTVTTTPYTSMGIGGRYQAKFAIVAMPPILSSAIHYDPDLPARRLQLVQRMPMGTIAKITCIYETAWWRTEGRSGQALGDASRTVQYIVDSGAPDVNMPGILTCFIQGNKYITWSMSNEEQRRKAVTHDIQVYFGGDEKIPVDYVEANWPAYPLAGGAYNAYASVGAWTGYGPSLRVPHGRIYWAGTEMATKLYGGMDGAISAGEKAATQILEELG